MEEVTRKYSYQETWQDGYILNIAKPLYKVPKISSGDFVAYFEGKERKPVVIKLTSDLLSLPLDVELSDWEMLKGKIYDGGTRMLLAEGDLSPTPFYILQEGDLKYFEPLYEEKNELLRTLKKYFLGLLNNKKDLYPIPDAYLTDKYEKEDIKRFNGLYEIYCLKALKYKEFVEMICSNIKVKVLY